VAPWLRATGEILDETCALLVGQCVRMRAPGALRLAPNPERTRDPPPFRGRPARIDSNSESFD
jgi:hypothetical protein